MRKKILGMTAGLTLLAAVTGTAVLQAQETNPPATVIEASFMFDVENLNYLAGYSDAVFTGTVERIVATQPEQDRTLYEVSVDKTYVGRVGQRVVVSQLGYKTQEETVTVEHQPQRVVGQSDLLAGGRADHGFSVVGGPEAAVVLTDANRAEIDRKWVAAAKNRQYPPDVPRH